MGSFSEICAFSHLPITEDVEVMVIVTDRKNPQVEGEGVVDFSKHPRANGVPIRDPYTYKSPVKVVMDSMWGPLTLPFKGVYDGYGGLQAFEEPYGDPFFEAYRNRSEDKDETPLELLNRIANPNDGVIVQWPYRQPATLNLAYIRKDIFDLFVEDNQEAIEKAFRIACSEMIQHIQSLEDVTCKMSMAMRDISSSKPMEGSRSVTFSFMHHYRPFISVPGAWLYGHSGLPKMDYYKRIFKMAENDPEVGKGEYDPAKTYASDWTSYVCRATEFAFVQDEMNGMGKSFEPTVSGRGHQYWQEQLNMAKRVQKICEAELTRQERALDGW